MQNQLKAADIIFLVFDINIPLTFYNIEYYFNNIKIHIRKDALICVLGNKADIQRGNFDIEFNKKIYDFIKEHSFYYAETSIFFENSTIYKEIVFFNKDLLNEEDYKNFFSQEDNLAVSSLRKSEDILIDKPNGYIIYNQLNNNNDDSISIKVFENDTYYNAGITVILDLILNEIKERKNIEIKSSRNQSGMIKLSSNIVTNSCSCNKF